MSQLLQQQLNPARIDSQFAFVLFISYIYQDMVAFDGRYFASKIKFVIFYLCIQHRTDINETFKDRLSHSLQDSLCNLVSD